MKTIADFKRAMIPGTKWHTTHRYINNNPTPPKDMGIRECGLNNSVDFGFINPASGQISHCSWPKKSEFSVEGNTIVITNDFCELRYTPQVKE